MNSYYASQVRDSKYFFSGVNFGGDSKIPILDKNIFPRINEENPLEKITRKEIGEILFDVLDEENREVILSRFAFSDGRDYSLSEVGKRFNLTKEGVRQREVKALEKMRKELARKGILSLE